MSAREIGLSTLAGRKVRDTSGRYLGRLVEVEAIIRLSDGPAQYVVECYHVHHYGAFDWLAWWGLTQQLLNLVGDAIGARRMTLPASALEVSGKELVAQVSQSQRLY